MISTEVTALNLVVQSATVQAGQQYYKLLDLFSTRDGSWEPSQVMGAIPQWARDRYLKPWGSPDYFDDAGGDHHVFGCVWDTANNRPLKTGKIHYYTWTDNANHVDMDVKEKSGWANVVMYNKYYPDQGEKGAWAWYPSTGGLPADIVMGGGMPYGNHISFFASWVLAYAEDTLPDPTEDARILKLEAWAKAISAQYPQGPQYV